MQEIQQNSPEVEDESGLAGLVVPAQAVEAAPIDPLLADRQARMAVIREESARIEAEQRAAGKRVPEPPQMSLMDQAQREEKAAQEARAASPFKISDNEQEVLPSWEEVVAKRQEAARMRRHQKELDEHEENQTKKEEFRDRVLRARQPETTVHRAQPVHAQISEQTRLEMEAGQKRSAEYARAKGATIMPVQR
jgi:hypothetical protein